MTDTAVPDNEHISFGDAQGHFGVQGCLIAKLQQGHMP